MATHPESHDKTDDRSRLEDLAGKAARCRRLAAGISDRQASEALRSMAESYERSAEHLKIKQD